MKREEDRWSQLEMKKKQDEERWAKMREDGLKARKNQSNVAYDILSLQYAQNVDGEQQKYFDDLGNFRLKIQFDNYYLIIEIVLSTISSRAKIKRVSCEGRYQVRN